MSFSSVAEYSFTAIDTSPNETAPFQIRTHTPQRRRPPALTGWHSHRGRREVFGRSKLLVGQCPPRRLRRCSPPPANCRWAPGWGYEFKWDGVRAIADIGGGRRVSSRAGTEITAAYPELAVARRAAGDAVFDGEIVRDGRRAGGPRSPCLAERMHVRDPRRAARLAAAAPVTYMIFDVLRLDGADLTGRPYPSAAGRWKNSGSAARGGRCRRSFADGPATRGGGEENGLEGVVAKRWGVVYRPGLRSPDWVKVKLEITGDFVVGGLAAGRASIGGLLVGVPGPRRAGLPGPGRRRDRRGDRAAVAGRAGAARVERSPFAAGIPREDARGAIWVRPQMVVEVKYASVPRTGGCVFPGFLRLRPDKPPEEVSDAG